MKYVNALFGDFRDAYTILTGQGGGIASTTNLDRNDTAIVLTGDDDFQLFLPENGQLSDRGLALVEIYNAMCRDEAGIFSKGGHLIPENLSYQGFAKPYTQKMKARKLRKND